MAENTGVQSAPKKLHSMMIDNRKKMVLSGVEQINYSTETELAVVTSQGLVYVSGSDMHVNKYSKEEGTLAVEGKIDAVCYSDANVKKGIFKRLLK